MVSSSTGFLRPLRPNWLLDHAVCLDWQTPHLSSESTSTPPCFHMCRIYLEHSWCPAVWYCGLHCWKKWGISLKERCSLALSLTADFWINHFLRGVPALGWGLNSPGTIPVAVTYTHILCPSHLPFPLTAFTRDQRISYLVLHLVAWYNPMLLEPFTASVKWGEKPRISQEDHPTTSPDVLIPVRMAPTSTRMLLLSAQGKNELLSCRCL